MNNHEVIKILIADDHAVVRSGIRLIFADEPDIEIVAEAENLLELMKMVREVDFDVLILDIKMPDGSGLDALKQLRSMHPEIKICMLSMYTAQQYAVRAFRSGAAGFLTKESAPDELITAVRRIARGGKYISNAMAESLAYEIERGLDNARHASLSEREFQVMCYLAEGQSITDIAYTLSLSVKTVSTYKSRILRKLQLKSTAELVRYAIQNNLIP